MRKQVSLSIRFRHPAQSIGYTCGEDLFIGALAPSLERQTTLGHKGPQNLFPDKLRPANAFTGYPTLVKVTL